MTISSSDIKKNIDHHNKLITHQVRLNNLKKIYRYKTIKVYIMYIMLIVSCILFIYFYKK